MTRVAWMTGLSGSGKSTIARRVAEMMTVCILDGDEVRASPLSDDLGYDVTDRERNNRRVAWVAKTVAAQGVPVLAALVAPTERARRDAQTIVGPAKFGVIWVYCPQAICMKRDPKGLYAQGVPLAGRGVRYDPPLSPVLTLDTQVMDVDTCARKVMLWLTSGRGDRE